MKVKLLDMEIVLYMGNIYQISPSHQCTFCILDTYAPVITHPTELTSFVFDELKSKDQLLFGILCENGKCLRLILKDTSLIG